MNHESDSSLAQRLARTETLMNGLMEKTDRIEAAIERISQAIVDMVRLDQKHTETSNAVSRAFTQIEKLEDRVTKVEQGLTVPKLISGWVIAGVLGVVAINGAAIIYLVLK